MTSPANHGSPPRPPDPSWHRSHVGRMRHMHTKENQITLNLEPGGAAVLSSDNGRVGGGCTGEEVRPGCALVLMIDAVVPVTGRLHRLCSTS